MKTYPSNKITEYATLLPNRIELDGEWEVAMTQFSYPVSYYNVEKNTWFKMSVYSYRPSDNTPIDVGEPRMYIPEGHYESAKELFEAIRHVWNSYWIRIRRELADRRITPVTRDQKEKVPAGTDLTHEEQAIKERVDEHLSPTIDGTSLKMDFNERTHKIWFKMNREAHHLTFSPNLAEILAMPKKRHDIDLTYVSETEIDVNRGSHTFFVYCDVVQDSIVGDVKAPLLRSVIARGHYGENVHEVFSKPMYLPLRTNQFDTVRISIKDESGRPVKFNYGNSCVTLHFRRVAKTLT
jgi:hypothetical protein